MFAGGFDLAAIKEVCANDGQNAAKVADLTARLVEKSLLLKQGDSGLYQLLETIRQYAAEQLVVVGELDVIRERHARYYLGVASARIRGDAHRAGAATPRSPPSHRGQHSHRARVPPKNRSSGGTRTRGKPQLLLVDPRQASRGHRLARAGREAAPDAPAELRATSLFCEGFLVAHDTDDWHAAVKLVEDGIDAVADASEPPLVLGMLHCLRGECDVFNGDAKSGVLRTETGLEIASLYPGTWGRGFCLWSAAHARLAVGDEDAAIALFTEEIELAHTGGYGIGEMCGCSVMGEIWEARGELETSRAFWERALHLRREVGAVAVPTLMTTLHGDHVHGAMPTALLAVARLADKQGDLATASKLLREGLPLAEEMREVATAQADGRAPEEDVASRAHAARHASARGWRLAHRLQGHERPRAGPERALASPRARFSTA